MCNNPGTPNANILQNDSFLYSIFTLQNSLEYTFSLCVQTHERNLNRPREKNKIVAFRLCITKLDWGEELPSRMLQV